MISSLSIECPRCHNLGPHSAKEVKGTIIGIIRFLLLSIICCACDKEFTLSYDESKLSTDMVLRLHPST